MTSTRCEIFNWALIPLTLTVGLFSFKPNNLSHILTREYEVYALYLMALIVTIQHIHYGICMVNVCLF